MKGKPPTVAEEDVTKGRQSPYHRRRSSTSTRKRVRWADEEQSQASWLVIAVLIFNGIFALLAVLSRWGLLWSPSGDRSVSSSLSTVSTPILPDIGDESEPIVNNHEIRDINVVATTPVSVARDAKDRSRAAAMGKRQTSSSSSKSSSPTTSTSTSALATATSLPAFHPSQVFEVDIPLLGPGGSVVGAGTPDGFARIQTTTTSSATTAACEANIVVHTFANSFESPFVGNYTPPACLMGDSNANTAVMNLTVLSQGRQFDRLFIVYFGDTEVFRSSTAEPKAAGISWTYMKDMSQYMTLWKEPQTIIVDLPNALDGLLDGTYNVTVKASFFNGPQALTPADTIIPISARQALNGSQPSVFTIPGSTPASNVIQNFPRNAARAIFSVSATGQGNEEFWWSNVLQSNTLTYNASGGALFGYSPFREVQVLIDGQLAGVQWPWPVIFTGGLSPSFWGPMVGIDAFDLKEGEIDITPWLGVLCDGSPHNFSMNVVGLNDDGSTAVLSTGVNSNWKITGKIFVWLDSDGSTTNGNAPTISGIDPAISVSQRLTTNSTGANDTLTYTTSVSRLFSVSGSVTTSKGTNTVSWAQRLTHTDQGVLSNQGANQVNVITTQGSDSSTGGSNPFTNTYSFPLNSNLTSTTFANGTSRLDATLSRTKAVTYGGAATGTGARTSNLQLFAALPQTSNQQLAATTFTTTQSGTAVLFLVNGTGTISNGTQHQQMRFGGVPQAGFMGMEPDTELYFRDVTVDSAGKVLGTDVERLVGMDVAKNRPVATETDAEAVNTMMVLTAVDAVQAGGSDVAGGQRTTGPGGLGRAGGAVLVVGN